MTETLWNRSKVAAYLGIAESSADKQLRRWSIAPVGREPGRTGQNLYPAAAVRAAHRARPGQGHRSDITRKNHPG
jgi:hypothetical protein